jgi:hypothetical protein
MRYIAFIIAGIVALWLVDPVPAGWGSGGCAPPSVAMPAMPITPQIAPDRWFTDLTSDLNPCIFLASATHPGRWSYAERKWYPWINGAYAAPVDIAPIPVPEQQTSNAPVADSLPTGVDWSQVGSGRYTKNGVQCSRDDVVGAIESSVTDESRKRHITVIAKDTATRDAALNKIGKPSWAVVKAYDATDWAVASEYGFVTGGNPTVYIEEPDGTVLHRQDDLNGLELAVRRADPKYDPAADLDLRSGPLPSIVPASHGLSVGLGALLVVLVYFGVKFGWPMLKKMFAPRPVDPVQLRMLELLERMEKKGNA